jgi:hypothetical protein
MHGVSRKLPASRPALCAALRSFWPGSPAITSSSQYDPLGVSSCVRCRRSVDRRSRAKEN